MLPNWIENILIAVITAFAMAWAGHTENPWWQSPLFFSIGFVGSTIILALLISPY